MIFMRVIWTYLGWSDDQMQTVLTCFPHLIQHQQQLNIYRLQKKTLMQMFTIKPRNVFPPQLSGADPSS